MNRVILVLSLIALVALPCVSNGLRTDSGDDVSKAAITGKIVNGLRIFDSRELAGGKLFAYRGDYVRIEVPGQVNRNFTIKELKIDHQFPIDKSGKRYFKLKQIGKFRYRFGDISGSLEVAEYKQANYRAVSASEGAAIIKNVSPFILDVRTMPEFKRVRMADAALLPVQVIQAEFRKLEKYREKPILIYCASGNRSTVASRILIQNGFKKIYNLRDGIKGWIRAGYKTVQ